MVWARFWEGFGEVLGRSGNLLGALGASQSFFVAVLVHFWVVWVFFNVLGQFLVIFVVCGYFGLLWDVFVECGLLGLVFLRIVVCGPFGRHRDLSACFGCFGSFLPCFFHLVAPRGASAASVARHQRGKSRKEERQDEEEAFLKFAWLFLLLLAIAAFYCFFFA